ncbi:Eco57I restriction-modification methylase domain-containing protein [Algoriphagus sp. A40]|uniref:class I SAM-dependent DNA methyltransferase n=1 Tax=Algoriphagus sp. A40 TaxID=1945863 RepID=UPI00098464B6|nr:TaqI-like C-terminal specificity domain-containing protein [Algoriphagus sp. A40]OOG75562.1 type II restriction endonuclease [Algoriphagus sp. A40]
MIDKFLKPKQALNPAFRKVKPNRTAIESFKSNLIQLIDRINESESEEFHKNLVIDFLKKTYYDPTHFVNTKGRNDLVIHTGDNAKSSVGVIIEAKKPTSKSEMISKTNLNHKAFQELVLYYLRERITHNNLEVKHLVVTNIHEWFIFDALSFDRHFAQNKGFVKQFEDFEAGRLSEIKTEFFYKNIAEPAIEKVKDQIPFTYFDFRDYDKPLRNADKRDDNKLIALFKLLSPEHLLKLPFANDSNSLDRRFYTELLHIIGLTETKEGGKKLIERKPKGSQNSGSILEDAIIQLDTYDKISQLTRPSQYGNSSEERLFNVGLELSITWINRVLFLKLLEAQLITYHKGDKSYAFLNKKKIHDWDDLNSLFFQVLAKKTAERNEEVREAFAEVPYLNSSLFEPTDMEQKTIMVNFLKNEKTIPVISSTVMKDGQGKKLTGELTTLEYLFRFLDAYDFASEGSEEIQEDNKTLINASVLGLIFEKINGYKDGSFFTPGFITMYMCRETIRKAVIQKFKEAKGWEVETIAQLYDKIEDRTEANVLINSLKICDPAVGSGHFLVSALNEIIAVKNDLKILQDRSGKRLKEYQVKVVNDELIVTDEDGELFEYHPYNKESQRIQETLFHEKQTIIENCLFGVDINPNSVKICRLRLWIELLKSAYYKQDLPGFENLAGLNELETLPNIDINIKVGNSLVSRFALDSDLKSALKGSWKIEDYKTAVSTYRNAKSKDEKRAMEALIAQIKTNFRSEISKSDPKIQRKSKLGGELYNLTSQTAIFEESAKEKKIRLAKVEKVSAELNKLDTQIEEIKANQIYENAFEWRFEFPEVLNDEGDFVGFDVVIGNPPYIRQEEFSTLKPYLQSRFQTFAGTADLYVYFVELSMNLLKDSGDFVFIIPNKWMRAGYGKALRTYVKGFAIHELLDFGDLQVFEEATTYPLIIALGKSSPGANFNAVNLATLDFPNGMENYLRENKLEVSPAGLSEEGWTLTDSRSQALLFKLKSQGVPLSEYVDGKIFRGVLTGLNEAFVIDLETKERLITEDPRSAELIKPFLAGRDIKRYQQPKSDKFLILIKNGQTKALFGDLDEAKAFAKISDVYPAVMAYLKNYEAKAKARYDKGQYWWELRACDYYGEFEKEKIIIPAIVKGASYCFDNEGNYSNDKTTIIPKNDLVLLGIMSSKTIDFYLKSIASTKQNGYFEYKPVYISQLPIINPEPEIKDQIEELVAEILEIKKQEPTADAIKLEIEIDQVVYGLYGLNEEEIGIVEGLNKNIS